MYGHHSAKPRCRMSRREMLSLCSQGFGSVALMGLLGGKAFGSSLGRTAPVRPSQHPLVPRKTHVPPRVRSVIFLYMDGGVSQVDSFDPKPLLAQENGQKPKFKVEDTQFDNNGNILASPWEFKRYGKSGIPVSSLFPHIATCADELAVVRSMVADFSIHTNANYFLHTGHGLQGRPSMGAWVSYGLGSENQNLPGFVVLNGGLVPPGGVDCFTSGFLPASYQGSIFKTGGNPFANIKRTEATDTLQERKLAFINKLDRGLVARAGTVPEIESAIMNYELAFEMQSAVPELTDLSGETAATQRLYGMEAKDPNTRSYGAQCLLARRLVERGVRFIELTCPNAGHDRWDQHSNLKKGHEDNARAVDQPIAGLIKDLKSRGLLDSTLLVFTGEFGRTPFAQGTNGRDHNPFAFSCWLAGGGVKGGTIHGESDEYGYKVVRDKVTVHDLHATMLHLLGMDHERLTYRFSGRDIRLTDVFGNVVHDILA